MTDSVRIYCPVCCADAGQACSYPDGRVRPPHRKRLVAYYNSVGRKLFTRRYKDTAGWPALTETLHL